MFDGCIDRGKSSFFSCVDDALFERRVIFDRFDRFQGDECGIFRGVGGGDLIEEYFDFLGSLGEVLGVDDFVALDVVALNRLFTNNTVGRLIVNVFSF